MASYDFSTLSSSDFEELVCDLLSEEYKEKGYRYKTFKDGKDKGIDFLLSTEKNIYQEVGQAKHYLRSGYGSLYSTLKTSEVQKIEKLKPGKYIFATSVDLSVANTESIKQLFNPYIKDLNDVLGKKDLNKLIESHENVLKNHYKLWFSDTTILEIILKYELHFRSQDYKAELLKKNIRLYVTTDLFSSAKKALELNSFIVITGAPGVGKSALAEMLLFNYLKDGYDFLHIYDDIKEFESFIKADDSKQIVYFDDFLGSNSVEINKAQGRERALISAIRKVIRTPNKYLIFTTRSHILNNALYNSEQLKRSPILEGRTLFELKEYTYDLKKQLLVNHIDESEINDALKEVLLEKETLEWIVKHHSFSPRSIEYITSQKNIGAFSASQFKKFIKENFDNPSEIWKHAYLNQIDFTERILLNTIFSFEKPVHFDILKKAFSARQQYNKDKNLYLGEYPVFVDALAKLDQGFIRVDGQIISLVNPSLRDFLKNHLKESIVETSHIISSVACLGQLRSELFRESTRCENILAESKRIDIVVNYRKYLGEDYSDGDIIYLITTIQNMFAFFDKERYVIEMVEMVEDWEYLYEDYALNVDFLKFLESIERSPQLKITINSKINDIIASMVLAETSVSKAVDLLEKLYETSFIDFEYFDATKIKNYLDQLFSDYIFDELDWLREWITDESEVWEKQEEINKLSERINILGIEYEVDMSQFNEDWWEIARNNEFRRLMEKDD